MGNISGKSKNNISSSSAADNSNKTSLLPEDVLAILQRGMTEGFKHFLFGDGYLCLTSR